MRDGVILFLQLLAAGILILIPLSIFAALIVSEVMKEK